MFANNYWLQTSKSSKVNHRKYYNAFYNLTDSKNFVMLICDMREGIFKTNLSVSKRIFNVVLVNNIYLIAICKVLGIF